MGSNKLVQLTAHRIFQAQVEKERFRGKRFLTVPDGSMNKSNSPLLDRLDRSPIKDESRPYVQGNRIAIQVEGAQYIFDRTGSASLPESDRVFQTPYIPVRSAFTA